jgi:GT2 family glycosyltransferase
MSAATPTVYIPTLEGGERLAACLRALEGQTVEAQVVVADNGPGDGCSGLLAGQFPRVKRVAFGGRNVGFGAALNRAVMAEGEGPVIFLNDDAVAEPKFVENLVSAWEGSGAAMIAGVLLKASDPSLVDSAGIRCDRTLTAWDYMTGEPADRLAGAPDPFGPTGGAALFDRDAFVKAGGFDERIFLYYEDLDLALRMRTAGHRCRLAASARAIHESSATLGRRAAAKYQQTGFSRGYLLRKYGIMSHPALALKVLASDLPAGLAQIVADRTAAGLTGRWRGWKAGRDCPGASAPLDQLEPARLGQHLKVRLARRRY